MPEKERTDMMPAWLRALRAGWVDYRDHRFLSLGEALPRWVRNRHQSWNVVPRSEWGRFKKSDTLFIFGSGPSVNDITPAQWAFIRRHDSMGLNFAFLTGFPMTLYYFGYEPGSKDSIRDAWCHDPELRAVYRNSLWFVRDNIWRRMVHPRIMPELFPPAPKIAQYHVPGRVCLDRDRPFRPEDFRNGLLYRGSMCLCLQIALWMEYRRIVLMGVDLHTYQHFYDNHPVMIEERERYNKMMSVRPCFESQEPKGTLYRTMEEYYYAVQEMVLAPAGVELFVGNRGNMLCPRVPYFDAFDPGHDVTGRAAHV